MALTVAQRALCRASCENFSDLLMILGQAGTDAAIRRAARTLLDNCGALANKAELAGTEYAALATSIEQLNDGFEDGTFDPTLAANVETLFNQANSTYGWGLPLFDTSNPQLPPGGGGAGTNI